MEGVVEGAEGHDDQSYYERCLQEGEDHSEKLVEPAQKHEVEYSFKGFAEKAEQEEHHYEDKGERHDLHHLLRCGDVLRYPSGHYVGESGRCPDADNYGNYGDRLGDEAFPDALDEGGDEANQKNDIQDVHICLKMSIFAD